MTQLERDSDGTEIYSGEYILSLLDEAARQGFDLGVDSPIEELTLAELAMMLKAKT